MKLNILSAALLLICFLFLAVLTGTVPVMTMAEATADSAEEPPTTVAPVTPAETEPRETHAPPSPDAGATPDPEDETPLPAGDAESAAPEEDEADELTTPEPSPDAEDDDVADEDAGGDAPPDDPDDSSSGPVNIATTIPTDRLMDNDTYYEPDPEALLAEGVSVSLPAEGYQVLILHTHTTEAYTPDGDDQYVTDDPYHSLEPEHSVAAVGEALADALAEYGLRVLHDTTVYDHPSYNGSYGRSGAAMEAILAEHPGIGLVIDLHRDALGDEGVIYRTLADIDGVEAAQLMFVMGTDVNLDHPHWEENLRMALTLQAAVRDRWPTLMRPLSLCDYRYNQQLSPGCLLLEVGTAGNTLAEAVAGVRLFAEAAGPVIASWISD